MRQICRAVSFPVKGNPQPHRSSAAIVANFAFPQAALLLFIRLLPFPVKWQT